MSLREASVRSRFEDGELYDVLLAGLDYGLEFYVDLAKRAAGPVLDIGCGERSVSTSTCGGCSQRAPARFRSKLMVSAISRAAIECPPANGRRFICVR